MKYSFEELVARRFCGAKTRKGTPCKQLGIYKNGRCKLHGGLSTGPKTAEGKVKAALFEHILENDLP
jgi:hypothetical protein